MRDVTLTLACGPYDRVRPLLDGRVRIAGANVIPVPMPSEESFPRAVSRAEFDVSELSLSSYLLQVSRGESDYVALPVFVSRAFRHDAIYVGACSGITKPRDLEGRLVGIPEYQMTLGLWVRGMLADEHGVELSRLRTRTAGVDVPGRKERLPLELPAELDVAALPEATTLNAALLRGEIDAMFSPSPPMAFREGDPRVRRLFPDAKAAAIAFHRRTGFHPIMHVVGVRTELLRRHPGLARRVFDAFEAARQIGLAEMDRMVAASAPPLMLPWLAESWAETRAVLGPNPWSYGVSANRAELNSICRWSHDQHLSRRLLRVEELFDPDTLDT